MATLTHTRGDTLPLVLPLPADATAATLQIHAAGACIEIDGMVNRSRAYFAPAAADSLTPGRVYRTTARTTRADGTTQTTDSFALLILEGCGDAPAAPSGIVLSGALVEAGADVASGSLSIVAPGAITLSAALTEAGADTASGEMAVGAVPIPAQHLWIGSVDTTSALVTVTAAGATDLTLSAEPVDGGATRTATASFDPTYGFARAEVTGLAPDTDYQIVPVINGTRDTSKTGSLRTRPTTRKAIRFGFASCGDTTEPTLIYQTIRNMIGNDPFNFNGDRWYNDITTNNLSAFHSRENLGMGEQRRGDFHRLGPVYYIWDDHDFAGDDRDSTGTAAPAARSFFRARVPMRLADPTGAMHSEQVLAPGFHLLLLDSRSQSITGQTILGAAQEAWLLDRIAAIGSDPTAVVCIDTKHPFIGSTVNTWAAASSERQRIRDAIAQHMPGRVFMIAGDAHMLAFDDGTNNDGVPMYHAAPLGRTNSVKGGPYSGGTIIERRTQFGVIEADPTAEGWTVTYRGYVVDAGGVATQRLVHTADLKAPAPVPDSAPVIAADPVLNGSGAVGTVLTVTKATVTGKPTPTETLTLLRDGTPSTDAMPYTVVEGDIGVSFSVAHRAENSVGVAERVSNEIEAVAAGSAPATVDQAILSLSPLLFLSEPSGSTIPDASGNGRHATITGAQGSVITAGPHGMPFFHSQPGCWARVDHDDAFNSPERTILGWVHNSWGQGVDGSANNCGIYRSGNEKIAFVAPGTMLSAYWNGTSNDMSTDPAILISEWTFVAMTLAASGSTLYTSQGAQPGALRVAKSTATSSGLSTTLPITLGARATSATAVDRNLNAGFAKIARWNRALTQTEIESIYNAAA